METSDLVTLLTSLKDQLPEMVADIEAAVACESLSADLEAVSRSAHAIAAIGVERLRVAPDLLDINGCTHPRWKRGKTSRRMLVPCHHDTVWQARSA